MKALILAAGKGTRLGSLAQNLPKPMVPFEGKPFVEHLITWLKNNNITDIVILTCYKAEKFEEYFGNGSRFGVNITYSREPGEEPSGTGGAVRNAGFDETVIVINGDTFFPIDLQKLIAFHKSQKTQATLALARVPDTTKSGLVVLDQNNRVQRFVEKGTPVPGIDTINGGIYVFDPSLFAHIPKQGHASLEREVFPNISLSGMVFDNPIIDIGTPEGYQRFQEYARTNR